MRQRQYFLEEYVVICRFRAAARHPQVAKIGFSAPFPGKQDLQPGGNFRGERFRDFIIRAGYVPDVKAGRDFNR